MSGVVREVTSRTTYLVRTIPGVPMTPEHAIDQGTELIRKHYRYGGQMFDLGVDLVRAATHPPRCGCGGWVEHPEPCTFTVEAVVEGPTDHAVLLNGVRLSVADAQTLADELNGAAETPEPCGDCGGFVQPGRIDGICETCNERREDRDDLARRFPGGRWQ